jgi:hypothetical protein
MDSVSSPMMADSSGQIVYRHRVFYPRFSALLCLMALPLIQTWAAEVAPCAPATLAQSWRIDRPRDASEGAAPVLVRRQASADGSTSSELRVRLPIANDQRLGPTDPRPAPADLRPRILWGDPASPFLFLTATSIDESQRWLHFMVLCRGGDPPWIIEHATLAADFPLVLDTGSVAEAPGDAFAMLIGEHQALLWRNRAPDGQRFAPRVLDWPRPVRALSVFVGDTLRVLALSDDGSLRQYQLAGSQPPADNAAEPVPGWPVGKDLLPSQGRVWLRDMGRWLYLLTEYGGGLRFEYATRRTEPLYSRDDGRLVAWDRFYSRNGRNTALFLLLGKESGGQTHYRARIYDLRRGLSTPILDLPFIDKASGAEILDHALRAPPQVFLQDWSTDEDFTNISGFLFHNQDRKGLIDRLRIASEFDTAQWRQVPALRLFGDQRQETPREILPHQVSVQMDGRRQRVFYFADQYSFSQPFTHPAELP